MPKTISADLKAHLAGGATTVCTCWRITRKDGTEFFFTDHDENLQVGSDTYLASVGYQRTAIAANSDMSVDNVEMTGIFDDETITQEDLNAGMWDYADIYVFLVNYEALSQGIMRLRRGKLGEVTATPSGIFKTELHGIMARMQYVVGDLYQPTCRADLGDTKCKVNLVSGGWQKTATVTGVTDAKTFTIAVTEPRAVNGWFTDGAVTFTSGGNNSRTMEVKNWTQGTATVELFLPMPVAITVGDTLNIYPGCNKTTDHCKSKFNNIVNMRAEPFVPGTDALTQIPQPATTVVG